jgi:GMP synthase-like glutamine amidotransferase
LNKVDTKVLTLGHVGIGTGTHEPFDQRYPNSLLVSVEDIALGEDIDALVIWGGGDISPTLYNSGVAKWCGASEQLSRNDRIESGAVAAAITRGIPIIGVCRGAQLCCAMAGGKLIQHVDGHAGGGHEITGKDGAKVITSSVHHQMMYPWDVEHELIAWSSTRRSRVYQTDIDDIDPVASEKVEPEIVWFPKIKALAIQGHPEFMREDDPFVQYCMQLVDQYILNV